MGGAIYFNTSSSNSLNSSIGLGLSGLNAARTALQTIGHNIANVNTPGYSKQETILATRRPQVTPIGAMGTGVDAIKIQATRDNFIEAQLAYEAAEKGRLQARDVSLTRMETLYNPTTSLGLADVTDNLFGAFQDLAANPEVGAQREAVMAEGMTLANASRHTVDQLKGMKASVNEEIRAAVSQINTILEDIAGLNVKLAGSDVLDRSLEDVRDERNRQYKKLNELIGVQSFEDETGALTITTGNGSPLVIGNQYATLEVTPNSMDNNALEIESVFNGVPENITRTVHGGTIGGLIEMRDQIIEDALSNQQLFAATLADIINIEHRQGTDISGNQGGNFFADPFRVVDNSAGADIDSITQVGDNATYEINYSVQATSTSGVTVSDINIDLANVSDLTKHDYVIEFAGAAGDYTITDQATDEVVATGNLPGAGTITFEGMSVDFTGQPNPGDRYELGFDGRTGMTGDVYQIEWTSATDYEIYNVSDKDPNPVATGTLAGNGLIFFDGLAVEVNGARAAGDTMKIDYNPMDLDSNLTQDTVAASGSAPGLAEPGNNENALRMANAGLNTVSILGNRTFSLFQGNEIASVGNEKASNTVLNTAQENFVTALEMQRESVSGVSLDEEAASLIQYQQAFTASSKYLSQVNELMNFLINVLGR